MKLSHWSTNTGFQGITAFSPDMEYNTLFFSYKNHFYEKCVWNVIGKAILVSPTGKLRK